MLVFGSNGKYKSGEKVDVDNAITNNGAQQPTLSTALQFVAGDKIVVLCNTGVTAMPTFTGTSTVDDMNSAFPSDDWNQNQLDEGLGMPMSGEMTWGTDTKCELVRAVAKIEIVFGAGLAANDVTGEFYFGNPIFYWGIYNVLQPNKGLIYAPDYASGCVLPSGITSDMFTGLIYEAPPSIMPMPEGTSFYAAEYNSSTQAKAATVSATEWVKDRTCIGLVFKDKMYYRLDLFDKDSCKYLDIRRNCHYKIIITKVKSAGYPTLPEALKNPGSNLEYEVVITGDEDNFTTSNGQYAVTTDKQNVAIFSDVLPVTTAGNLVKFRCEANGVADVTTRTVRLVGADKSTVIPTTQLQMCKSDDTPVNGNEMTYTATDEAGYQLKFTSPDAASLPDEQVYVEICYGNIRHYVPVNAYIFDVVAPSDYTYVGGTQQYTMTSYKTGSPNTGVAWNAEFSEDGGATWSSTLPSWVTAFTTSSTGETTATPYDATIAAQIRSYTHEDKLKATTAVSGTYDLSTKGGSTLRNTANCYIVNAPGNYSLPLVYGNAIKGGANNTSAYTSGVAAGQENILYGFTNHRDTAIVDPYIYNNYGCVPESAELVWQDAQDLITAVGLSADKHSLTFTVTNNIAYLCQGNAVVAVKNTEGQIMWSWHIWVTDYVLGTDNRKFTNATLIDYHFMPVNIGWCYGPEYLARSVKVRFTQHESGIRRERDIDLKQLYAQELGNSPYFQWGRKDPFVAGMLNSSNAIINKTWYDGSGVEKVDTPPAYNSPGWIIGQIGTGDVIQNGILNPDTFCANQDMEGYYYNLWSANNTITTRNDDVVVKTIYDPSPVGYHVPASNAFTGFTSNGQSQSTAANINGTWDTLSMSWTFVQGNSTVNFPAVGYRQPVVNYTRPVMLVGKWGRCWSVTPIPSNTPPFIAGMFSFTKSNVNPVSNNYKAFGDSVRPVAE